MGYVLESLRSETKTLHRELDHHPAMVKLLSPALNSSEYLLLLKKFFGFFLPLEQSLNLSLQKEHSASFGVFKQQKTAWLQEDFQKLGATFDIVAPTMQFLPGSSAEALGVMYVLEGSALGGQIIAKHLAKNLGLTAATGARYFYGNGPATHERWQLFCLALEEWSERSQAPIAEIVAGAQHVFIDLRRYLDQN